MFYDTRKLPVRQPETQTQTATKYQSWCSNGRERNRVEGDSSSKKSGRPNQFLRKKGFASRTMCPFYGAAVQKAACDRSTQHPTNNKQQ